MALFSIPDIKITGISTCVPQNEFDNLKYHWISLEERKSFIRTTGIAKRRIVKKKKTATSDLCFTATEKLLKDLKWDRKEIELLIFVSQSRDYVLPQTACILQDKLGLSKECMALDMCAGCSAYPYGLSVIGGLMTSGEIKKGLLLIGDISSANSYRDKSFYPLAGDAGTATALEYSPGSNGMHFNLQTDGAGYNALIIPDGGFRNYASKDSFKYKKYGKGVIRHNLHVALDGIEIFNFALREVAPNAKKLLKYSETDIETIDYFVFHQANKLINETVRKILKVQPEKCPYSLDRYGNTSSASIPLTIVTELNKKIQKGKNKMLLSGFGVGLSWGSVIVETDKIKCPEVIDYEG